jgi:hypothetical protein
MAAAASAYDGTSTTLASPCATSVSGVGFRRSTRRTSTRGSYRPGSGLVFIYVGGGNGGDGGNGFTRRNGETEPPAAVGRAERGPPRSSVPPCLRVDPCSPQPPLTPQGTQLPPTPCPEQRTREKPPRVQCTGRNVGCVVQVRACMKRSDGGAPGGSAGSPDLVHCRRARHVADVEATVTKPAAQVGVFPIQEEALIESARREERVSTNEEASARQPVHDDARRAASNGVLDHHVAPGHRKKRQQATKSAGATEKSRKHVWIAPCASLHSAVRIKNSGPNDCTPRVGVKH